MAPHMIARTAGLGLTLAAFFCGGSAFAQSDSPFASLAGSWTGGGTIAMTDGHHEKIRCRADYEVTPSGIIMHQNLKCASDSYKFEVRSSLQADGEALTGTWTETTRQATGEVKGSIHGDQISTSVHGTGFSATLGVTTKGNAQSVSIRPEGTDIQAVTIDLKRA